MDLRVPDIVGVYLLIYRMLRQQTACCSFERLIKTEPYRRYLTNYLIAKKPPISEELFADRTRARPQHRWGCQGGMLTN